MDEQRNSPVASPGTNRVQRSVTLAASPDEVWESLTRADRLGSWFGAAAELDPRPGGRARFRWPDGTVRSAVLEEVEPRRLLSFRWLPFVRIGEEAHPSPPGRVEFELREAPDGARLTVTEWTTLQAMAMVAT